jgi:hypothetical protein
MSRKGWKMSSDNFDPYEYVHDQLRGCNHTEIYQLCRRKGVDVSPSMSHEQLVNAFLDESANHTNVFDSWRHGLTGFVFENWKVLEPQLTCPIRSKDPKSCWGCLDTQVVTCITNTAEYEQAIQLHRKP